MANPRHGKEKPLYPTKTAVAIILGIGLIIGILIVVFLVQPIFQHAAVTVPQHIHPNTGRAITKTPQIKAKVLTVAQLHSHHLWHVAYLAHEHVLHVKHLLHIGHEAYVARHATTGGR